MKQIVRVFLLGVALVGPAACPEAGAYNEGGHYYTLLALFDGQVTLGKSNFTPAEIKLQTFCAELPDLGRELDAVTQRISVLEAPDDWGWGLVGSCMTKASKDMVASQVYLHGLSGASSTIVRLSAQAIIRKIDDDLKTPPADSVLDLAQLRRNLLCARGFAAHLYGDSFAHVKLSSEQSDHSLEVSYETGLGHARDGHKPDYLYGPHREGNQWAQWVTKAAADIAGNADEKRGITLLEPCGFGPDACEAQGRIALASSIRNKGAIVVADMQQFIATGTKGVGGSVRATTCDEEIAKAFPATADRPDCKGAWTQYLNKAIFDFFDRHIDPTERKGARAKHSCSAWRCSDKEEYDGEEPVSCKKIIVNELSFGRK